MIFVDSNIPMYLVGADHPNKPRAQQFLEEAIRRRERLVTDVEAFQEILHRYAAIQRLDAIQPAFDALQGIVETTFPIDWADIQQAKELLLGRPRLSARDALHYAIIRRHSVGQIMTFDTGFDRLPDIVRIPAD